MESLKSSICKLLQEWKTQGIQMSPDLQPLADALLVEAVPIIHQFVMDLNQLPLSFALKKFLKIVLEQLTELGTERGQTLSSISLKELKDHVSSRISGTPISLQMEDLTKLNDLLLKLPNTPKRTVSDRMAIFIWFGDCNSKSNKLLF